MGDTRLLTRRDVTRLLSATDCVAAVERAFRLHAEGRSIAPGVLGTHVAGGGFHVKTAGLRGAHSVFVAKVNANFPENPARRGLPTIQGVIALFDAESGRLLALLDSMEITSLRTAAATAVAARHLAREDAGVATICGCGEQGRAHLRALAAVRTLRTVLAFDADAARAARFADEMTRETGIAVAAVDDLAAATRRSDVVVTCTPARRWILGRGDVRPGAFVAAVGADNPEKQELEPALLAASTVVVDVLEQCATIGDLHHALDAGVMTRAQVHAELADVVSGAKAARRAEDEVIVFDSTGTALEDVAVAWLAYERAVADGVGMAIGLGSA
ncbi:ornithine cyclodeaminase family protein [Roseisolibacter agri]|uniref:Cyclodeaminase n=1 Tax=Roseisolibacter agri TaxID=2014610 RepID=A0AA37PZF4_9BACT|nr:ornithine cyclodeaminase family protein [Roseisolibacter agri]GLC23810.1 cyclodeaminase [Roseisolibacter agri]